MTYNDAVKHDKFCLTKKSIKKLNKTCLAMCEFFMSFDFLKVMAIGWGRQGAWDKGGSKTLQKVNLNLYSTKKCKEIYEVNRKQFIAEKNRSK